MIKLLFMVFVAIVIGKIAVSMLIPILYITVSVFLIHIFLHFFHKYTGIHFLGIKTNPHYYKRYYSYFYSQHRTHQPDTEQSMSRQEAFEILGLPTNSTPQEIKTAYHNLIKKLHPDHGGSSYLARKINLAKKILID